MEFTATTVIILLIAATSLCIAVSMVLKRIHQAKYSDKITFIRGDKEVTISKSQDISTQRRELVSL